MGDYQEKILPLFAKAMDKALLQKKVQFLEKKLKNHFGFQSTTWISDGINQAKDLGMKVSATDTTVLPKKRYTPGQSTIKANVLCGLF